MKNLSIDIETYSDQPLPKTGVYRYVEDPDFVILLFGYAFDDDPVEVIDLTERMLHPSQEVEKTYLARVSNELTPAEAKRLESGVMVDGRKTARAKVKILGVRGLYTDILVTIHEGRNRQVRRMCAQAGLSVLRLKRVREGEVWLDRELKPGQYRKLTQQELAALTAQHGEKD